MVIKWLSGQGGAWRLSHAIKEAIFLASSLNISFKWIPREANEVADGLATRGVQKESTFVGSLDEEMILQLVSIRESLSNVTYGGAILSAMFFYFGPL